MSGRKVSERSTEPPGFAVPHYFYIHNISSHDFGAIQTPRAEIYIFTMGTPYKISSRALLPPSLRTGIFTVECACPEPFRVASALPLTVMLWLQFSPKSYTYSMTLPLNCGSSRTSSSVVDLAIFSGGPNSSPYGRFIMLSREIAREVFLVHSARSRTVNSHAWSSPH